MMTTIIVGKLHGMEWVHDPWLWVRGQGGGQVVSALVLFDSPIQEEAHAMHKSSYSIDNNGLFLNIFLH